MGCGREEKAGWVLGSQGRSRNEPDSLALAGPDCVRPSPVRFIDPWVISICPSLSSGLADQLARGLSSRRPTISRKPINHQCRVSMDPTKVCPYERHGVLRRDPPRLARPTCPTTLRPLRSPSPGHQRVTGQLLFETAYDQYLCGQIYGATQLLKGAERTNDQTKDKAHATRAGPRWEGGTTQPTCLV